MGRPSGFLGRRMWLWPVAHEPLHHVDGHLQADLPPHRDVSSAAYHPPSPHPSLEPDSVHEQSPPIHWICSGDTALATRSAARRSLSRQQEAWLICLRHMAFQRLRRHCWWRASRIRLADCKTGASFGRCLRCQGASEQLLLCVSLLSPRHLILPLTCHRYAPLPTYQVARIGITPLALIFSCFLQKESFSGGTLSSALIATLNLFFASYRSNVRVTWESVVAGVFSSIFVALYPILLLRTYRLMVAGLIPQGDLLSSYPSSVEEASNKEETRAFYRTLHYTSLITLMLLTPIVLISGELPHIYRNIPFLDVPFFWAMMLFGGMGSWAVFSGTLLLVKATSPLTATFVNVPRSAFQLVAINLFRVPSQSWVGVILCWISSLWFLLARRDEGKNQNRLRLEGR